MLPLRHGGNLLGGVAGGEHGVGVEPLRHEPCARVLEVGAVVAHLLRFAQVELLDVAGHPPVRHVHEHQRRPQTPGQLTHVREDRLVGRRVLEGNEDPGVHHPAQLRNVWARSQALRAAIRTATTYARVFTHLEFTNSPIFRRSEVNQTSGNTAKDSCRLRIT